jgi:hypothetical protein
MEFFSKLCNALGRQLTNEDRRIFVDFERATPGELIKIKCHACGTGSVAVRWRVPTMKFLEHLEITRNIEESMGEVKLPEFGCFFMNPKDKLGKPLALCGHAFPGFVKGEGRFQKSCPRDLSEQINGFGLPLNAIASIQDSLRAELRRKVEAEEAERRRLQEILRVQAAARQRQQEERIHAEKQRADRIKGLADLVLCGS